MEGIRYRDKSTIPENIKSLIITRDVHRYYASIYYEIEQELPEGKGTIGIDMGIRAFITASDGIQVKPLNALRKEEKRLAREQSRLSGKEKGSNLPIWMSSASLHPSLYVSMVLNSPHP